MPDRPGPKLAGLTLPNPTLARVSNDQRSLRAVNSAFCQAGDLLLLSAAFLATRTLPLVSSRPTVLASALSIRNLLVGAVCIATWRMILVTVGVYSVANQRAAYLLRCLIALNSCALVVGLIQFVLLKGVLAWRAVALFWLLGLILMLLLRTLLLVFDRPAAIGPSPGS